MARMIAIAFEPYKCFLQFLSWNIDFQAAEAHEAEQKRQVELESRRRDEADAQECAIIFEVYYNYINSFTFLSSTLGGIYC